MNGREVHRFRPWGVLMLAGTLVAWGCEPPSEGVLDVSGPTTRSAQTQGQGGPPSELAEAMTTAIQDEYHAWYTYAGVLASLGEETGPFDNIVLAEIQHVAAITWLFDTREWDVPDSEWSLDNVTTFATRVEACMGGVEAEGLNIALYDQLLLQELPDDVRTVFESLQAASRENHLPAFEACSVVGPTEAMEMAIQDEYFAEATYRKVLDDLGDIAPFTDIFLAEGQHVAALAGLFVKRDLPVPESQWADADIPSFPSKPQACLGGVEGEEKNIALYDELLPLVEETADVLQVFENLRAASLFNHLPAFEACAPAGQTARAP